MITRRDFFKMAGLAAAGLGTGYTAGKWIAPAAEEKLFSIHGFLPADREAIAGLVALFSRKTGFASHPVVLAAPPWKDFILTNFRAASGDERSQRHDDSRVVFRMTPLSQRVPADILVFDDRTGIYRPESDFTLTMATFRNRLRGRTATQAFTAEARAGGSLMSFLTRGEKVAVIENGRGVFDRIPLSVSFRNVVVPGPQGRTVIEITQGAIHVHSAPCRNQICRTMGPIFQEGQSLACAPNQVVIRIEVA